MVELTCVCLSAVHFIIHISCQLLKQVIRELGREGGKDGRGRTGRGRADRGGICRKVKEGGWMERRDRMRGSKKTAGNIRYRGRHLSLTSCSLLRASVRPRFRPLWGKT